jgi:hypothetical protein
MNKRNAVGLALQIAYEYPDWGDEHVSEMLDTYQHTGEKRPCNYDELMMLTSQADRLKKQGLSFDDAEKKMLKAKGGRVD